jgi:ribulose-5-phosphate 4-epimerase/fuculose-1-phosphate aldolase
MKPPSIVKFKVELISPDVPGDERVEELRRWCIRFNALGLTPEIPGQGRTQGNLSFRLRPDEPAFVITGSTLSTKGTLAPGDFVTVLQSDLEEKTVYASGTRDPSSESMLHFEIYLRRPDVGAIFHGHDRPVTAQAASLGLPETAEEKPSGSVELLQQVMNILGDEEFLVMKNHGFLALGRTMDEAGQLALRIKNTISQRTSQ